MSKIIDVVFLQGGGEGAHDEDAALAASLASHLGDGFRIRFPLMPNEDEPDYDRWRPAIDEAVAGSTDPVVLVGHSLGGHMLLSYLAEQPQTPAIRVICIIAAPFPGGDPAWTFDDFELPDDLGRLLPRDAAVLLYASPDDAIVPFAHRDLYADAIPGAVTRTTTGGHQLGDDLRVVADDIRDAFPA